MQSVIRHIGERQNAIQDKIDELRDEERLWRLTEPLRNHVHVLRADDAVSKRTAQKLAVLGQVARHLTRNSYNRQVGATAGDIFHQIKRHFPNMSDSTFRSHLTRFGKEGRLTYDAENGTWRLAKREEEAP